MHYHLLGSGVTLFLTWQVSSFVGIAFGKFIPEQLNLEFIIPLSFIAIIVPTIRKKYEIIACFSAGFFSILYLYLNIEIWIVMSAISSIFVAFPFIISEKKK